MFKKILIILLTSVCFYAYSAQRTDFLVGAVVLNDIEKTKQLLASGIDINQENNMGRTALHYAQTLEMAQLLINIGADIDIADKHGCTPLYLIVGTGNVNLVNYLISKGAKIDIKNKNGCTPLSNAVFHGKKEIIELLIELGADKYLEITGGFLKGQKLIDLAKTDIAIETLNNFIPIPKR